jgi:hypothetical protein
MADVVSFDTELIRLLKEDRLLFIAEVYELGKKFGLSQEQVDRVVTQAEVSGTGLREVVLLYVGNLHG